MTATVTCQWWAARRKPSITRASEDEQRQRLEWFHTAFLMSFNRSCQWHLHPIWNIILLWAKLKLDVHVLLKEKTWNFGQPTVSDFWDKWLRKCLYKSLANRNKYRQSEIHTQENNYSFNGTWPRQHVSNQPGLWIIWKSIITGKVESLKHVEINYKLKAHCKLQKCHTLKSTKNNSWNRTYHL